MFVPPPGHPDDGKCAALPIGASMPSPWMTARSIPSRAILMWFAWIPGSPSAVVGMDAAGARDPGGDVGGATDGESDARPAGRVGEADPAVGEELALAAGEAVAPPR